MVHTNLWHCKTWFYPCIFPNYFIDKLKKNVFYTIYTFHYLQREISLAFFIFWNPGYGRVSSTMKKCFPKLQPRYFKHTQCVSSCSWFKKCHFGTGKKTSCDPLRKLRFLSQQRLIFFSVRSSKCTRQSSIWHFGEVHLNLFKTVSGFYFIYTVAPLSQRTIPT